MSRYFYRKGPKGGYQLVWEDEGRIDIRFETDRIFALVGIETGPTAKYLCLYKHGREATVQSEVSRLGKFLHCFEQEAVVVELSKGALDDINHFINTSALPICWLERFDVIDMEDVT